MPDRLGIGYDDLNALNPRLVYVSITGFGPSGPYSDRPAYDPIAQGLVGMMHIQGQGVRRPATADPDRDR